MANDDELDPAASTQMFQAFVDRREPEESGSRSMLVLAAALVGLVVVLALAWLLLRG